MSRKTISYCISVLIGILFFANTELHAQNDVGSEAALKKEAQKAFEDEQYDVALKFYLRLLSANIKDPLYNYRYGVCLLNASPDKDEAVKFLEKASKDADLEKEVFFYYGKALQLNYRFNDAITAFTKYKSSVSESKAKKMQVDHLIESCNNGKNLLRHITDLQVVDKKELNDKDFFLSYDLTDIGGRLLVKPDDFKTALDKKKKENSIIFLSPDKGEIYFSSYGSSDENGKDLYVIKRLPNGEYGKPVSLGYPINTEYDEDYPFLHPNGKVLYFASKGHNSMGGYDIFKSERNEETGAWGKPQNLDFAINTPDDDILFVTDKDEKTAFFASTRGTEKGKVDVYRINLQRKPVDICIFKGQYIPRKAGDSKMAKISVKNVDVNEVEGVFKSSETDGEYLLNLPNGGKYLITVETQDGDIQSDMLIIPQQFETVPIRQEITYNESENGKMHLNTLFGQSSANDDRYSLAVDFIKERSKLDVNVSKDTKEVPAVVPEKTDTLKTADTTALAGSKTHKNLSNEDLIHIAEQDALDLEKEAKDARDASDKALVLVNEKNQKAQELNRKVDEANTSAAAATNPEQKQNEESRADALQILANTAETEAASANNFYKNLDADASKKKKEANLSGQYANDLAVAIKSKSKDAMAKLDAQKEALDKLSEEKTGANDMVASIQKDADAKQKEVENTRKESLRIKDDIKGIEAEITNLNREGAETKNEQLKAGINSQVETLKTEIKTKEADLTVNDQKLGKLQNQAENLNNEAYLVYQMNEKIKSGQVTSSNEPIDKAKLDEQIKAYHPKELKHATSYENKAAETDTTSTSSKQTEPLVKDIPVAAGKTEQKLIDDKFSALVESADTKPAGAEKEQAKADGYKQWSDALNIPIEDKKEELNKIQDPSKRAILAAELDKLKKEQEEKQQLAKESQSRAEKLKPEHAVAANPVKTTGVDSTLQNQHTATAAEPVKTSPVTSNNPSVVRTAVDDKFKAQTTAIDTISKPLDKETARADIYKNWVATIESDVEGKKKELSVTGDKDQQDRLNKEIKDLEADASEKRKLEKQSTAAVEKLKKEEAKLPPVKAQQPEYENSYNSQLAVSDQSLKPGASKDSSKAVLYSKWADALSEDIAARKKKLSGISDKTKRNAEEQTIADLQTELAGKQAVAQKLASHAAKEKTGVAVVAAETETRTPATQVSASGSINNSPERNNLENESQHLKTQADSVYGVAMKLQGDDRAAKLKESNELEKQSRAKQSSALAVTARANETEYIQNRQKLSQYASQPDATTRPGLARADSLKAIAKASFEKALKLRESAAANTSYYAKQEDLKSAEELEHNALGNQNQALLMYAATYTDVKPALTDSAGVAGKESASSENPVVKHTIGAGTDTARTSTSVIVSHTPVPDLNSPALVNADSLAAAEKATNLVKEQQKNDEELKKSASYKRYMKLKAELDIQQTLVRADNKNADGFQMKAQAKMGESDGLMRSSEAASDSMTRLDDVKKAKEFEDLAAKEFAKADSTRSHARLLNEVAIGKRKEANDLLDAMDPATKASILALSANETNPAASFAGTNPVASAGVKSKKNASTTKPVVTAKAKTPKDANPVASITPKTNIELKPASIPPVKKAKESNPLASTVKKTNKTTAPAKPTKPVKVDQPEVKETAPGKVAKESFAINTSAPAAKFFSIDKELPGGLLYKVQIGAFRNAISPTIFKGMNPLTGETTPQGFIRYTAGLFTQFESAEKAKNEIHALGFKDAFVVAFFNGKRISVDQANAMVSNPSAGTPVTIAGGNTAGYPNPVPKNKKDTTTNNTSKPNKVLEPASVSNALPVITHDAPAALAKTNDVTAVKGLFYTVQVGVFSNPVSNEKLFGIQPLNAEKMANGNLRYTTGQYNDVEKATEARNKIVETGVKDAFVVAYYNGQRLSVAEAKQGIVPSAQTPVRTNADNGNSNPGNPANSKPGNTSGSTPNVVPSAHVITDTNTSDFSKYDAITIPNVKSDTGVIFKVQIGAFKEQVPIEIANKFLLFARRGVASSVDENGNTVYTIGQVKSYDDAQFLKEEATAKGIPDAFILAFKNGKKVPVAEVKGGK